MMAKEIGSAERPYDHVMVPPNSSLPLKKKSGRFVLGVSRTRGSLCHAKKHPLAALFCAALSSTGVTYPLYDHVVVTPKLLSARDKNTSLVKYRCNVPCIPM
jgi:hypothetical protein